MEKISGVYGLRCKTTDKWYIGVSVDVVRRWHTGYELLQCRKQTKIYRAILKYGYDDFEKIVLEKCDKSEFKPKETFWIAKYNAVKGGYNLAPGGEGGFRPIGIPCSDETKRKISEANKGKKHTEKFKQAVSKRFKGVPFTTEHKSKISKSLTGVPLTDERKQNISASLKGKIKWTDEDKLRMSETRTGKLHPRWEPLSISNQKFIRTHFQHKSANWIRMNMPEKISQKKLYLCLENLGHDPYMAEITDFL